MADRKVSLPPFAALRAFYAAGEHSVFRCRDSREGGAALAATWLIPKLGAFEREQQNIDLQLIASTRVIDLKRDQVGCCTWSGFSRTGRFG